MCRDGPQQIVSDLVTSPTWTQTCIHGHSPKAVAMASEKSIADCGILGGQDDASRALGKHGDDETIVIVTVTFLSIRFCLIVIVIVFVLLSLCIRSLALASAVTFFNSIIILVIIVIKVLHAFHVVLARVVHLGLFLLNPVQFHGLNLECDCFVILFLPLCVFRHVHFHSRHCGIVLSGRPLSGSISINSLWVALKITITTLHSNHGEGELRLSPMLYFLPTWMQNPRARRKGQRPPTRTSPEAMCLHPNEPLCHRLCYNDCSDVAVGT